jgi:photosystem II stability/assembly factor-like uncharacterized protein
MRLLTKIFIVLFALGLIQTARAEWVKQNSNTLAWLRAIHFADENAGWIGGTRGTFLTTKDGGDTWEQASKFTDDTILDIFFKDRETGWLLCERDIFDLGARSPSYLLKTTDGGGSWERIEFKNERRRRITKIFFAGSGFGLAIGETGTLYGLEDDNRSWKPLASPSSYLMLDGTFTDNLRGTIVGGGGTILFTEDAGASWDAAFISDKSNSKLNSVFFVNGRSGWAAGSKGKIFQTINGGKYWRLQKTNTSKNLNDIFFADTAEGWAVGDEGTILHTTTGGNVWREAASKSAHKLEKIFFKNGRGWIIGFGGTLLTYETQKETDARRPKFRTR